LPARLTSDWENTRQQFDDLRTRIEEETDYQREARMLTRARSLFREDDGIVVPQVFGDHLTARVLTMQRLRGAHVDEFLATNPSQDERNAYARKMVRAWYRMFFAGRLLYVDLHPGNFVFMDDRRLGVIDFGCMMEVDDSMWELFRRMDRSMTTGRREDIVAAVKEWSWVGDDPVDDDRVRLMADFAEWSWGARSRQGAFDFGDEADFRRGIDLFMEMVRKRYSRARPCTPITARQQMGLRAMLYRLKAKIEVAPIAEEEVRATGWDRSDYALASL
jgi:predicted unusual protein kinase regulating ubiquinone biosynthesis (AarF/ABC1/UbiB family)